MSRRVKIDRRKPINELSSMCKKHFGKDYEHWNWAIEENFHYISGEYKSYVSKYGVAIELPKYTKNGELIYTDPFISYSSGATKGLIESANKALDFMYSRFENIQYDYSNPYKPEYK